MATIREELVWATINRAYALIDTNIHKTEEQQHEFRKQTILADESLTEDEKSKAIRYSTESMDHYKLLYNEGIKRICENCQEECLATLYCEYCIRNYLKSNFQNWTSGNDDVDNLIQQCQLETLAPNKIVEWIPYNNLQNIKYLTRGGFSEIYTADLIDGCYFEWDYINQRLKRVVEFGAQYVALKKLENVESANRSWFEEGKSHLTICNKYSIVQCYGLTKDPSDGNYMLVMCLMDTNLRNYLHENHYKLTWKERLQITYRIIYIIFFIHQENAIHRDLHAGNILYDQINQLFYISDLGFCGPANKPLNSVYGNLPYIAPEVIAGKETTFASDIYSFGMLMWEISSGQPPFINYENDYDLAMNIINGMRPKIVPGTPLKYKKLMEQCWDASLENRPNVSTLEEEICIMKRLYYQNKLDELETNHINKASSFETNHTSSRLFTSKVHQFGNFPEPKNATEEEQEAFHSKPYSFSIPDYIDDLSNKSKDSTGVSKGLSRLGI